MVALRNCCFSLKGSLKIYAHIDSFSLRKRCPGAQYRTARQKKSRQSINPIGRKSGDQSVESGVTPDNQKGYGRLWRVGVRT
ncbi:hypothetical protein T02_10654 [Trichinella nativa]|uniref:Uncharacterized protein n=1 Tax=Trichinella nativa TaxID=6335 RepID=A0A0V1L8Q2_9BILA|nr:hypothetical protein T06_7616 [Trichinella sp. T6]KRZ55735.1 hypothetical protein T02_10654 [Trichinella nativa]